VVCAGSHGRTESWRPAGAPPLRFASGGTLPHAFPIVHRCVTLSILAEALVSWYLLFYGPTFVRCEEIKTASGTAKQSGPAAPLRLFKWTWDRFCCLSGTQEVSLN
jgi:hypothetical protein